MAAQRALADHAPRALGAKVGWRLGLPAIALMLLSSLDRVNISFAALGMNGDLGLTPSQKPFQALLHATGRSARRRA